MKNILFIIIATISLISCTEVVDIQLNTDSPKLVVEANINWQKGTSGNNQIIKLTTTTNFYTREIPVVNGAIVSIKNEKTNEEFNFIEGENTGVYKCSNFNPILNDVYTLKVTTKGTTYEGSEKLTEVAPIKEIIQEEITGFNKKQIRVRAKYIDPQTASNYYLFNYNFPSMSNMKPDFYVGDDVFTNGNEDQSFSFKDDIKTGDVVKVTHFGISQQYYNYLNILFSLAGSGGGGGPFQAPPVSLRGNLLNKQNDNDYPYGYFSLSETDSKEYIVK